MFMQRSTPNVANGDSGESPCSSLVIIKPRDPPTQYSTGAVRVACTLGGTAILLGSDVRLGVTWRWEMHITPPSQPYRSLEKKAQYKSVLEIGGTLG